MDKGLENIIRDAEQRTGCKVEYEGNGVFKLIGNEIAIYECEGDIELDAEGYEVATYSFLEIKPDTKLYQKRIVISSISTDPFYHESNMEHLRRGIAALNAGKGTEHEINLK